MDYYFVQPKIAVTSILEMQELFEKYRDKNILFISSPSLVSTKKIIQFIDELKNLGTLNLYDKIKPDAPLQDVELIVKQFSKPDIIIAVGGGSVLDSAKALSVGWQDDSIRNYFYRKSELPKTKIETIAIPTTAGTGAELSFGAILFDKESNVKGGLRGELLQPNYVIIDVDLYLNASSKLISETGFDCLTHAVETYLSKASSPIVKIQSVTAINTFFDSIVQAKEKDYYAMQKMAIAAALMGVNLALSSTCLPHRLQYALRNVKPHSHAQGLICLYKGWLDIISVTNPFKKLADDLKLTPDDFILKINAYKKLLEIDYSLSDFGFNENDLNNAQSKVSGNLNLDPCYDGNEKTIMKILENSL
jgi:alcohol dehydrogenase class IV